MTRGHHWLWCHWARAFATRWRLSMKKAHQWLWCHPARAFAFSPLLSMTRGHPSRWCHWAWADASRWLLSMKRGHHWLWCHPARADATSWLLSMKKGCHLHQCHGARDFAISSLLSMTRGHHSLWCHWARAPAALWRLAMKQGRHWPGCVWGPTPWVFAIFQCHWISCRPNPYLWEWSLSPGSHPKWYLADAASLRPVSPAQPATRTLQWYSQDFQGCAAAVPGLLVPKYFDPSCEWYLLPRR